MNETRSFLTMGAIRRAERLADTIPNVALPVGERPTARIIKKEITEEVASFENLRMAMNGAGHRAVAPGVYTVLHADGELQMSDTPAEKADHATVVRKATGDCLIMGLGIGMVAQAMALKPEVEKITVIEINADVIDLVAPHMDPKIEIIHADALTWQPPAKKKWDVIWHDIWPVISLDTCETRNTLSRRYARRWRVYHGAWAKDEIIGLQKGRWR